VKIDMSENVGILKRYLIKGSRGNICCSSTFFFCRLQHDNDSNKQLGAKVACHPKRKTTKRQTLHQASRKLKIEFRIGVHRKIRGG